MLSTCLFVGESSADESSTAGVEEVGDCSFFCSIARRRCLCAMRKTGTPPPGARAGSPPAAGQERVAVTDGLTAEGGRARRREKSVVEVSSSIDPPLQEGTC